MAEAEKPKKLCSRIASADTAAMPTTSEQCPFPKLPRELRDLVYERIVADAPILTRPTPEGGYNFTISHLVPSSTRRISKRFASELQQTIDGSKAPLPKLTVRDHGIKIDPEVPAFVSFFSEKVQELDCLFYCTAGSKASELRDHVRMVEQLCSNQAKKAHVKIYMQRRPGMTGQDFRTLRKHSKIGPLFLQIIGCQPMKSLAIYSCDNAVESCVGVEETVGAGTYLMGLWKEGGDWVKLP